MDTERWRPPASPEFATVALRFAAMLRAQGANDALVAAAWLAADAEQRGDIGIDLSDVIEDDVRIDGLALLVPVAACLDAVPPDHPLLARDLSTRLYLRRQWAQEIRVATALDARLQAPPRFVSGSAAQTVADASTQVQERAAADALRASLFVLGGGPGTGKTRSIALIRDGFLKLAPNRPVLLAAPTGKAAQRLRESLEAHHVAMGSVTEAPRTGTVHRLLKDRDVLTDAAAVIIDEASMLDLGLLDRLLAALTPETALVLVGDPAQLASVEAGRVLGDLFEALSLRDPDSRNHCLLRHNFRADRALFPLAEAARAGDHDAFAAALDEAPDHVAFYPCHNPAELHDHLSRQVDAARADGKTLNAGVAFLCAHRAGSFGVTGVNAFLEAYWPHGAGPNRPVPILLEASVPELDLWNGDLGELIVQDGIRGFRRGTLFVPEALLPRFAPGYALTVHRAQGSEFASIVLVLPDRASAVLSRELLYTAITRARQRVVILGAPASLETALARPLARSSGLGQRLGSSGPSW
ncbi:MAG: AAA family ATPase [Ahniella sp.]|nr:AAA family ATPase [Ahniella sp.]